jgi:hypothetical protein
MADNPAMLRRPEPAERSTSAVVQGPAPAKARRSCWRMPVLILGPVVASRSHSLFTAAGTYRRKALHRRQHRRDCAAGLQHYQIAGAGAHSSATHDQIASIRTYKSRQQQVKQGQASLTFAKQSCSGPAIGEPWRSHPNINPYRIPITHVTARAALDLQVADQAAAIGYSNKFLLMMCAALLLIFFVCFSLAKQCLRGLTA